MNLLTRSHPRTVGHVVRSEFTVKVTNVQPTKPKGAVDFEAFGGGQRQRCKACRAAVVEATHLEADVVLVGEFTGDKEPPVNGEDTVVLGRVGRRVHLDVLAGIVGVGEHVAVLPREDGVVGQRVGHQSQFSAGDGGGRFTDDVTAHDLVGEHALVQDFTFRDGQIKVNRLHRVGDGERFEDQDAGTCCNEIDLHVLDACTRVGNGQVQFVDQRVPGLR